MRKLSTREQMAYRTIATLELERDAALAREAALRDLHQIATETLGQFADENQKLHADLAECKRKHLRSCQLAIGKSQLAKELQQRLTVVEQRNTSITGKFSSCKDCGSSDLFWFAQNTVKNGIQQNRLNTHDVQCVFFLGCNHCSATLKQVSADTIAEKITAALKPAAEGDEQ